METKKIRVYNIEELKGEIKEQAINEVKQYFDYGPEQEEFNMYCEEKILEAGFTEIDLYYDLNFVQGRGLSFTAKDYTKMYELYLGILGEGKESTADFFSSNTEYRHDRKAWANYVYCTDRDIELEEMFTNTSDNLLEVFEEAEQRLNKIYENLCEGLLKEGSKRFMEWYTDDYNITLAMENELIFTERGQLIT